MDVNLHERHFPVPPEQVGALIESLAGDEDSVWPSEHWPAMWLENGLRLGSAGGHGPIRYAINEYVPGQRVRFQFSGPSGFSGWHELAVVPAHDGCDLRHTLSIDPRGLARVSWPVVIRPLHDALVEDAFAKAATTLGLDSTRPRWSWWVRLLRRALRGHG